MTRVCVCPHSPSVLCSVACSGANVSESGKRCEACAKGKTPNKHRSSCDRCNSNEYWQAEDGQARAQCIPCDAPLEVSKDNDTPRCVCGVGMYNASVTTVHCIDDQFSGASAVIAIAEGCQTCPPG